MGGVLAGIGFQFDGVWHVFSPALAHHGTFSQSGGLDC